MTRFLSLLLFVSTAGYAQSDTPFVFQAREAPIPPVIDGVVDDSVWALSDVASDFIQFEPNRGAITSYHSEARLLFDEITLYISFVMWDPEPVTAQLTRRDEHLTEDDAVAILLDSHFDRRSAYLFMTNPLGTQMDGRIADDGRTPDLTWDAPWVSAASLTDEGWSAEIAIPFSSIKYVAGENQTWGINFGRSRSRNLETSWWAGPLENMLRVSQSGIVTGINAPQAQQRFQAIAYGLGRIQEDADNDWDAGGDVRYKISSEMSAFATFNPDFATIEADQEEVNLTRFELSLPEKRPFFLEGSELFRQRIRTFYSRRIPDITAGGRMLGKAGPWTMVFLGTHTRATDDMEAATYSVARAQRDVMGSSNMALTMANRTIDGHNDGSLGLDATLFFTRTIGMTAQLIKSWGAFNEGTWGYFIRPALDTPTWHFHVRYTSLGENFGDHVNAVGFVRDDDRHELDSALDHTFWIQSGPFERIMYESNYNIYWSQEKVLRSWQIDEGIGFVMRNKFSLDVTYREEFKRYEKDFRNRQTAFLLGYNTRAFESAQIGYRFGRNYDSDFHLLSAGAALKPTNSLSIEYELQYLALDPDPDDDTTWIHVARINQFFTKDLYLQLFGQTNSAIDRRNIQAVFVYRYKPPFGTIQLAFQRGTAAFGERSQQGNTLFLKATYVL